MNKQQLASKIWESANKMRSTIEANDYKDYILGFMFYKYLSTKELSFMRTNGATDQEIRGVLNEKDATVVNYVQSSIGYFIAYDHLFTTWVSTGSDFDIANVRDALSAFSRLIGRQHKKVFDGIFDTLQTGLSKLGTSAAAQTKAARDLIYLIDDIPMDGSDDYDVLGFIYEYLISNFAANAGKKAGEFYTPHEVSVLMSQIVANHLKDRDHIEIYDPTSGSGSLLLNIGDAAAKHMDNPNGIKYYAQELKRNTYNLTRMNLVMRGISPDNIYARNADTLEDDWPYFDDSDPIGSYKTLYVDAVVSNPPYSQVWEPEGKETDPRYARFGLAPKSKADYAFLLHDLYHLKPDGVMTIVLPHGVLFRGGEEGTIRKNLIENNHIDAIIGLPSNIFFGTGIPTIIMVLRQKRETTGVQIIDASQGFGKEAKQNVLRARDIRRIVDVVTSRGDIENFSRVVSRDEIRSNDYNLNIPRYVAAAKPAESWDLYASVFGGIPAVDINGFDTYWDALPGLKEALFAFDENGYAKLKVGNVASAIVDYSASQRFCSDFAGAFEDFRELAIDKIVRHRADVSIAREEDVLSDEIFSRLAHFPLVDRYQVFQMLDDQWKQVSLDLEMIQTEGEGAVRRVDPNMVSKKQKGKDVEVQQGWVGHIVPFELVQRAVLLDKTAALDELREQADATANSLSELLDSLGEEDAGELSPVLNDDGSAFIPSALNAAVKALHKNSGDVDWAEGSPQSVMIHAKRLIDRRKAVQKHIKEGEESLEELSKTTIEQLNDEQAEQLLIEKWVTPLMKELCDLPSNILSELASKINDLSKKYETTFADIERDIHTTEQQLGGMLDQLTGSDTDMLALAKFKTLLMGD